MERKVGEIFTYNGKTYQVVRANTCKNCAFFNTRCNFFQTSVAGICTSGSRKDNISVSFKLINNMENNQLIIDIPKGMEIDLEKSNLAKGIVKFKKKDITYELKPFDKVLVRDSKSSKWRANLFSHKNINEPYYCVYASWNYCIPYEGNEHLLGTTKDMED